MQINVTKNEAAYLVEVLSKQGGVLGDPKYVAISLIVQSLLNKMSLIVAQSAPEEDKGQNPVAEKKAPEAKQQKTSKRAKK